MSSRASPAKGSDLTQAAQTLREAMNRLRFGPPAAFVYNPLEYAWAAHEEYLRRFGAGRKRVVFLGMNPGPFGMAQTGVPFGEISAVRDWLGIKADIGRPANEHPKRPVEGFGCQRSEVSGQRLWGLFAQRFSTANKFFAEHFVANYCPLAFMEESGRNLTPDKLSRRETELLFAACDEHLRRIADALQPDWLIGIGDFAERQLHRAFSDGTLKIGKILHPSPASPAANKNWAALATRRLESLGVW